MTVLYIPFRHHIMFLQEHSGKLVCLKGVAVAHNPPTHRPPSCGRFCYSHPRACGLLPFSGWDVLQNI